MNEPIAAGGVATLTPATRPNVTDERVLVDGDAVLVLPLSEMDDGTGVYPEGTVTLVKQLRAFGIDARFLHPAEHRMFRGTRSAVAATALTIVLGVISSAVWDGLKRWIGTRKDQRVEVTFGQIDDRGNRSIRWWRVEGDADAAVRTIDRLMLGIDDTGELTRQPESSGKKPEGTPPAAATTEERPE